MLNEKKKKYFAKLLNQKLDELLEDAKKPVSSLNDLKDLSFDFVDQASDESDIDLSLHFRERESKLIGKIKKALERLEEGTFGICEECGGKISEKRLKARPVASFCITCKKRQEADEKLRGL